jgi:hypothetical protein
MGRSEPARVADIERAGGSVVSTPTEKTVSLDIWELTPEQGSGLFTPRFGTS